jgi:putative membrane protein
MSRVLSRTPIAALCAAVLVAACAKGDTAADSSKMVDSTKVSSTTMTTTPAATATPAAPALTDPNIVALLDEANMADSAAGSVAASKGTSPEIKSFGKDMMRDHHALRKAGQDLAAKLNVTPVAPAGMVVRLSFQAAALAGPVSPAGAAWDKAYIDHEVTYHEAVLATAQSALGAAQNAELKALIEKAAPNLQAHLDHAKSIQSKLK